jgi:hypothetical protein
VNRRALLFGGAALAACKPGPPRFLRITEEFVYTSLSYTPLTSVENGIHRFAGAVLDEQIDDYGEGALKRRREWLAKFERGIAGTKVERLLPEDRADFEAIGAAIARMREDLEVRETHRHSPALYASLAARAMVKRDTPADAPDDLRWFHLIRRLELIPKLCEVAKRNLIDAWDEPPMPVRPEWTTPAPLQARLDKAAAAAFSALGEFAERAAKLPRATPPSPPQPIDADAFSTAIAERIDEKAPEPAPATMAEAAEFLSRRVLGAPHAVGEQPGEPLTILRASSLSFAIPQTPLARRLLRNVYPDPATAAGWPEYWTQMAIEEEFRSGDEALRQAHLRRLREIARNDPYAFAGWRDLLRLREAYRRARGRAYLLTEFHERVRREGALPLAAMCRLLAGMDLPPIEAISLAPNAPRSAG